MLGQTIDLAPYYSTFFPPSVLDSAGVPVQEITGATIRYLGPVDSPTGGPASGWMDWLRKNSTLVYAAAATVFVLAITKGRR